MAHDDTQGRSHHGITPSRRISSARESPEAVALAGQLHTSTSAAPNSAEPVSNVHAIAALFRASPL